MSKILVINNTRTECHDMASDIMTFFNTVFEGMNITYDKRKMQMDVLDGETEIVFKTSVKNIKGIKYDYIYFDKVRVSDILADQCKILNNVLDIAAIVFIDMREAMEFAKKMNQPTE